MAIFIAVAPIDPARNELTQAFVRDTQEAAETIAAEKSRPGLPWVVFELQECARTVVDAPRVIRSRQPSNLAGDKDADPTAAPRSRV